MFINGLLVLTVIELETPIFGGVLCSAVADEFPFALGLGDVSFIAGEPLDGIFVRVFGGVIVTDVPPSLRGETMEVTLGLTSAESSVRDLVTEVVLFVDV